MKFFGILCPVSVRRCTLLHLMNDYDTVCRSAVLVYYYLHHNLSVHISSMDRTKIYH